MKIKEFLVSIAMLALGVSMVLLQIIVAFLPFIILYKVW
jgi:hypothetical protein